MYCPSAVTTEVMHADGPASRTTGAVRTRGTKSLLLGDRDERGRDAREDQRRAKEKEIGWVGGHPGCISEEARHRVYAERDGAELEEEGRRHGSLQGQLGAECAEEGVPRAARYKGVPGSAGHYFYFLHRNVS